MRKSRAYWWLLAAVPALVGLARLHFDVEVLNLLPTSVPAVEGLALYQRHFANAGELVVTVRSDSAEASEAAARTIGDRLRPRPDLVSKVYWQPPWLENPAQIGEFIAYLWFNQPPALFGELTNRLALTNLPTLLAAARQEMATSMSPGDMARLSYDPFGLTQLPEAATASAPAFGQGQDMFASSDGTFRLVFVEAQGSLQSYRDCARWLEKIQALIQESLSASGNASKAISIGYTGRPAFVAEIAGSMERDMTNSVIGTALTIALLFWLAHRRWRPMFWLLTLLALILVGTLGLGGLFFGTINVISMGFAAILLGLAVDYAVVHYQEALAHPTLSIPEVRHEIAPSIFWAATTTIAAFLVLNLGGLPGLAQLGSLVALGVGLSALVMIFAYLPPLFPERRQRSAGPGPPDVQASAFPTHADTPKGGHQTGQVRRALLATAVLIGTEAVILLFGLPKLDTTADALRPRHSQAYRALDDIKLELGQNQEPFWLLIAGTNAAQVEHRLDAVGPVLARAASNHIVSSTTLPTLLWPRPEQQQANRHTAGTLASLGPELQNAATAAGFTEQALGLTRSVLETWRQAASSSPVFWPSNDLSRWILEKLVARKPNQLFALGLIYPGMTNHPAAALKGMATLSEQLDGPGVWLTGWPLLGNSVFKIVRANLWRLVTPMVVLVLASLCLAFRAVREVSLSLAVLGVSGLGLVSVMQVAGWSWNLFNLMALPLILGTGVDYSIFMQLALRRYGGDLAMAQRSVGRALLLCGGTAVAGFGSLAFSSNAGMASLGQVCAVGIAFNVLISVVLLPFWWKLDFPKTGRSSPR